MTERQYDDQGNVRPADGRFRGEGVTDGGELLKIREQEIADAELALARRRGEEEAANQARLEKAGYVNPTTPEYLEREQARREELARAAQGGTAPDSTPEADPVPSESISAMMTRPEAEGADVVDTTPDTSSGEAADETPADVVDTTPDTSSGEAADETPADGGDRYDGMSYPALRQEATGRDLSGAGSAEDLKARLRAADAGNQ